jgi:hypothetical protein
MIVIDVILQALLAAFATVLSAFVAVVLAQVSCR